MNPEQKVPCPEIEEQLSAYLDGELTPGEREAVDAHLPGCPECTSMLEALREVVQSVGSIPRLSAPEGFSDRVVDCVRPRRITPIGLRIGALVAAASVLLVVSLYVGGVIGQKERRGRDMALLHREAPGAKLAGEPAPAAPVEGEGYAVGRGKGPALGAQMEKDAAVTRKDQLVLLAYTPEQEGQVQEVIGRLGVDDAIRADSRRAREEKDPDKKEQPEREEPSTPPALDEPQYQLWKSFGEAQNRKLTPQEVDGLNRALTTQNLRDLSLPQDEADQILGALSRANVKVLLLDQEEVKEEPGEEAEEEAKAAEAREEFIGKLKERARPMRESVEKLTGEKSDARELLEYVILRIKIAQ